ncbi:glycosyltransferase family 2 protein [Cyanobium sp. AMD-g]|uniref:glycosyltransferase family 2 protein n=1 Tax=Cyanobium sp. AMD-g TaxID=2823699 RepID=UPI0020CF520B|nr:glycosyltransferase family A protein [Cyanobium sp. AMD-g]MCP9930389.1 glycosyltransferase family 2 protein [Cyanobium sp. AMD-g]
MTSPSPRVSVVLPVYNGLPYLHAAISSILSQSFSDFELIVIDDGSVDGSASALEEFDDQRLRFLRQDNQGLARTLNHGISLARGIYVARQDQDDLSHPDRLALQVAHMEAHQECVLVGSWAQIMEVDRLVDRFHRHPLDESTLRYQLLFNNPFVHSSVLLRRSAFEQVGGYTTDPARQPPEDYELWSRLSRIGSVANLGRVLLVYREIPGSMSRNGPSPFRKRLITLCAENIAIAAGLPSDDPSALAIAALTHGDTTVMSQSPDFSRMQDVLLMAIQSLAAGDLQTPFRLDAISRIHAMKAGWIIRESPAYDLLHRPGPIRNVAKRLWQLVKRLRGPQ